VVSGSPLADPLIQSQLQAEAMESATVGFLVWDEDRRYIAANNAACEILGTTLDELLGQRVGGHTTDAEGLIEEALRKGYAPGPLSSIASPAAAGSRSSTRPSPPRAPACRSWPL